MNDKCKDWGMAELELVVRDPKARHSLPDWPTIVATENWAAGLERDCDYRAAVTADGRLVLLDSRGHYAWPPPGRFRGWLNVDCTGTVCVAARED